MQEQGSILEERGADPHETLSLPVPWLCSQPPELWEVKPCWSVIWSKVSCVAAETDVFPWLYRDDNFPQFLQIEVRHQEFSSPGANFWTSVNKLYVLLPRFIFFKSRIFYTSVTFDFFPQSFSFRDHWARSLYDMKRPHFFACPGWKKIRLLKNAILTPGSPLISVPDWPLGKC